MGIRRWLSEGFDLTDVTESEHMIKFGESKDRGSVGICLICSLQDPSTPFISR